MPRSETKRVSEVAFNLRNAVNEHRGTIMKTPLGLLVFGVLLGGALVFFGAVLAGASVNVSSVVTESNASGSGRYVLSVDTSASPTKYVVLDSETGVARVFTDTGILFETRGPDGQASVQ